MSLRDRFKNAYSAFMNRDPTPGGFSVVSGHSGYRPDKPRFGRNTLYRMLTTPYTKIAVDCSLVDIVHVRLDETGRYKETLDTSLNRALTKSANVDQTGKELIREAVLTMLSEGFVAIAPVRTDFDPRIKESYKIYELRAAKIKEWFAWTVRLEIYDEDTGKKKEIVMDKDRVAIIENPFYGIMNGENSTGTRLLRVLNQLDRQNDQGSSGKLDMIVQLPYVIKTEAQKRQAEERRKSIEDQITNSQLGIAYVDGTERIVQLNRSLENNLWQQAKDLQEQLYNEMGISKTVFDGTANDQVMLNYTNQTIKPILVAITEEMERKWITPTAQTQGQAIRFFSDPFELIPVAKLAELADKLTRNEIMSSNEIRTRIGLKPVDNARADELRNANLNHPDTEQMGSTEEEY